MLVHRLSIFVLIFTLLVQMTVGMTFYKMFMGKISTLIMAGDEQIIKVRGELSHLETYIQSKGLDQDKVRG